MRLLLLKLKRIFKFRFNEVDKFEVSGGEEIMRETIRKVAGPICLSWSSKIVTLGDIFSSVIPNAA